jgi:hypothetical protein
MGLANLRKALGQIVKRPLRDVIINCNRRDFVYYNLEQRFVVLYTRKKKGGHLTPRKGARTQRLYEILSRRHNEQDKKIRWVFWHIYTNRTGEKITGPYRDRHMFMRSLCQKAGVKYFRFLALRHASASVLDQLGFDSVISNGSWDVRTARLRRYISTVSVMTNVRP